MTEREQEELMARLLAGETLTPEEHRALLESAANVEATMAVDQVLLDRLLRHHFTNADRSSFTAEVLARLESATAVPLRRKVVRHLAWQRWRWAAAAAVFLLAGSLWLRLRPGQAAAGIVASTGAVWPQGEGRVAGASLAKGERLRLESGFVSLHFASGAEVVLDVVVEQIDYLTKQEIQDAISKPGASVKHGERLVSEKPPEGVPLADKKDEEAPAH